MTTTMTAVVAQVIGALRLTVQVLLLVLLAINAVRLVIGLPIGNLPRLDIQQMTYVAGCIWLVSR